MHHIVTHRKLFDYYVDSSVGLLGHSLGENIWLLITLLMEGNNSLMEVNIIYNQFLYKSNGAFTGFPESVIFVQD